jgi:hypothetical protein
MVQQLIQTQHYIQIQTYNITKVIRKTVPRNGTVLLITLIKYAQQDTEPQNTTILHLRQQVSFIFNFMIIDEEVGNKK